MSMGSPSENVAGGDPRGYSDTPSGSTYAISGKIMLSAIIILFTVVILIVCLHIYARWCLLRDSRRGYSTRRNRRRRRVRRAQIVFSIEPFTNSANNVFDAPRGLAESVLKSLPTFVYSSAAHGGGVPECAVCLSEFEDDEKGRLLPNCNHSFHVECIDMWFQSHSTCPLCRTPVTSQMPAKAAANEIPAEVAVPVAELETGTSSGLCPSCSRGDETGSSSASSSSSASAVAISIEVPRRGLEEEHFRLGSPGVQGLKSPGGQQGLKSPGGRIQSLKRIFSRERKGNLSSPSSATSHSYSTTAEIDLENGDSIEIKLNPGSDY